MPAAQPFAPEQLRAQIAALLSKGAGNTMTELQRTVGDPETLSHVLGALLQLPVQPVTTLTQWDPLFTRVAFAECARRRCAVLRDPDPAARPHLVVTDPFDTDLVADLRTELGDLQVSLTSTTSFDAWLIHCETAHSALGALEIFPDAQITLGASADGVEAISLRQIGGTDSPAVRFVNSTLYDALKTGASDIHLESDATGLQVKFRLDGVLTAMRRVESLELATQAISRIKVMAQLDIAERRIPQDGRLQIAFSGRAVDVRVSVMPSIHGEDAVLRVLDRQHLAQSLTGLTLTKLGFEEGMAEAVRRLCRKPHGMFLVTGPTGSGKTTTLYAAVAETHQTRDKVITIEDPVEYQLPGVLQVPVNERKGLTFARGLRSILRHDPDKILVGEIRDAETAHIAVQSALTGHLVFTSVHANNAFDVLGRFEQFGVDAYTFASAVNGVLAQRLVRRVCSQCATPMDAPAHWQLDPDYRLATQRHSGEMRFVQAPGCESCRGSGYQGRFAVSELLMLTPAVKALVSARAAVVEIQAEAQGDGWLSLRTQALDAAMRGETTLDEVERVAG